MTPSWKSYLLLFQYNDHELPSQLSPDQYFKLEWALSEDRQELDHPGGEGEPS